jgi:hypothetical protein
MLTVASFLGKGVYNSVLKLLGDYRKQLAQSQLTFPSDGPSSAYATLARPRTQSRKDYRIQKLDELDNIVSSIETTGKVPALQKRWNATKLDCLLFAQLDQYK